MNVLSMNQFLSICFIGNPGADGFPGRSGIRGPKGAPVSLIPLLFWYYYY